MKLKRIISGGQTGADCGALYAAATADVETGGFAPREYRTERGPNPLLADFGLVEHENPNYAARTCANVLAADATLLFGKPSSGTNLTEALCIAHEKPHLWVQFRDGEQSGEVDVVEVVDFIRKQRVVTLNVAGNRESVNPGMEEFVEAFMASVIECLREGA